MEKTIPDGSPVPDTFSALGFSGLFRTTSSTDQAATARYSVEAPCLLRTPGWMVLSVQRHNDGTGTATLVRRDGSAVTDLFTGGQS